MKRCNLCGKIISEKKARRHKYRCNKTKKHGEYNEYQYEQKQRRERLRPRRNAEVEEE